VGRGPSRFTRREFIRRSAVGGAAVGVGGSLLAACSGKKSTSNNSGKAAPPGLNRDPETLIVATVSWSPDFDPASYFVNGPAIIDFSMYEGLIRTKLGTVDQFEPALAESWSSNKDKSVWTFNLRTGVSFWDGTPVTAEAIKAAYIRTMTLGVGAGSVLGTWVTDPEHQIVVADPGTLRFDLGAPSPPFENAAAAIWGTGVISPEVTKRHSTGTKDQGHQWLQSHAAGSGAYMLESFDPGNEVVLVQNPNYWGGWTKGQFKKIIIQQIPDGSARREALESGAADMITPSSSAHDVSALRQDPRFYTSTDKAMYIEYIILGAYGPLESPLARQAVNCLFPHDAYVKSVMLNTVAPTHGCFPDLLVNHDPNAYVFPTSVEQAKSLFAQAGVAPGTEFTYEFFTGYGDQAGAVLQAQFEQAGMKLTFKEKAYSAFLADLTTPRPVEQRANMYFWSWYPDYDNAADFCWPILSADAFPENAAFNSGYYDNATVTDIINKGYTESDPQKLQDMMTQLQGIINKDDPPWVPVDQVLDNTCLRTDIKGYVANPLTGWVYNYYPLSRSQ
jgi:peptide/nickel transport system substrate-binding protein